MTDWSQAACQGADIHLFVPDVGPDRFPSPDAFAVARRHCGHCPIRPACAELAAGNDSIGIFGGLYWRRAKPPVDLLTTEEAAA